jgi:hypothetical protein
VRPRLTVLVALGSLACGGRAAPGKPVPQSLQETLAQFMAAVKANDLNRMGELWGSDRGPASTWMKSDALKERLTVMQKYLDHTGYRVIDGPQVMPGHDNTQTFHVEIQRANSCTTVFPVDIIRSKLGGWVVNDVHLASLSTPGTTCRQ